MAKLTYVTETGIWKVQGDGGFVAYPITPEQAVNIDDVQFLNVVAESEQLDELSRRTLVNYTQSAVINKSDADRQKVLSTVGGDNDSADKHEKRSSKRWKGILKATNKLSKEDQDHFLDQLAEVEQLDELSRRRLAAYIEKASHASWLDGDKKLKKRSKGVEKALHKTNEEAEEIDEGRGPVVDQVRRASDITTTEPVRFTDKHSTTIPLAIAKQAINNYDAKKDPRVKQGIARRMGKNLDSFKQTANEEETMELDEGLRKIGSHKSADGTREAHVYKDSEWGEHRVKFHRNGVHQTKADYHTDDKEDAHDTAKHFCKEDVIPPTIEDIMEMVNRGEALDETSKEKIGRYLSVAASDLGASAYQNGMHQGKEQERGNATATHPNDTPRHPMSADHKDHQKVQTRRRKGITRAGRALTGDKSQVGAEKRDIQNTPNWKEHAKDQHERNMRSRVTYHKEETDMNEGKSVEQSRSEVAIGRKDMVGAVAAIAKSDVAVVDDGAVVGLGGQGGQSEAKGAKGGNNIARLARTDPVASANKMASSNMAIKADDATSDDPIAESEGQSIEKARKIVKFSRKDTVKAQNDLSVSPVAVTEKVKFDDEEDERAEMKNGKKARKAGDLMKRFRAGEKRRIGESYETTPLEKELDAGNAQLKAGLTGTNPTVEPGKTNMSVKPFFNAARRSTTDTVVATADLSKMSSAGVSEEVIDEKQRFDDDDGSEVASRLKDKGLQKAYVRMKKNRANDKRRFETTVYRTNTSYEADAMSDVPKSFAESLARIVGQNRSIDEEAKIRAAGFDLNEVYAHDFHRYLKAQGHEKVAETSTETHQIHHYEHPDADIGDNGAGHKSMGRTIYGNGDKVDVHVDKKNGQAHTMSYHDMTRNKDGDKHHDVHSLAKDRGDIDDED